MKEIQRISVTDAVVNSIREMIESGQYEVGHKLPAEAAFCEQMKVSRTCVREALRVLQTLGYVEIRPGKGAFVGNFRQKQSEEKWYEGEDAKFYDFMEVRIALESLSVRLSVERATDEQIKELAEVHHAFVAATEKQEIEQMIMLDELFHSQIALFSNNQLLININRLLLKGFRAYRGSTFTNKDVYRNAIEPHAKILECFQRRDSAQAVAEMNRHLGISKNDMEIIHAKAIEKGEAEV